MRKVSAEAAFPCGQCDPCRINKRRVWAHRIILESMQHDASIFLTLTYDDAHLPDEFYHPDTGQVYAAHSVNPEHHRLFFMNLRNSFRRKTGRLLRFYAVGEYGEKTQRPHYHYAVFGFPRCTLGPKWHGRNFVPCVCPSCKFISDIWGKGHIFSGDLSLESSNYIAGYVTKKLTSDKCNCATQDVVGHHPKCPKLLLQGRYPEFSRQSRSPGIAGHAVDDLAKILTSYKLSHNLFPRTLVHGSKVLPLGRYLSDKLNEKMGIEFAPGEKLQKFEAGLRSMLLFNPEAPPDVPQAYSGSVALALELLNSQKVLNLETKTRLFAKEKVI